MNQLVSIIVPVYNVEKYLSKCLDSILAQTHTNIEILCINDGSSDNSHKILDNYAIRDTRIKVYNQINSGLIAVRKKGVELASADLVTFVDSDDYTHPNYIESLLANMLQNDSDISVCSFDIVNEDGTIISKVSPSPKCQSSIEALKSLLYEDFALTGLYPMWNKLYKKLLFESINFPSGNFNLGEDQYQNLQLIDSAQKISFTSNHCYSYVQRSGSIMKTMKVSYIDSFFQLLSLKKNLIQKHNLLPIEHSKIYDSYFGNIFDLYGTTVRSKDKQSIVFFENKLKDDTYFRVKNLPLYPSCILRFFRFILRRYLRIA